MSDSKKFKSVGEFNRFHKNKAKLRKQIRLLKKKEYEEFLEKKKADSLLFI